MIGAGKTELESRVGWIIGGLIKRICTLAWTLTGICAVAMYAGRKIDVDQVYGLMARDLLPGIFPGLLGLFIASSAGVDDGGLQRPDGQRLRPVRGKHLPPAVWSRAEAIATT